MMTLQDAVDKQFYEEPAKRIIRKPNKVGWCDVWFSFGPQTRKLMVNIYQYPYGFIKRTAPFQQSDHTDWILI